MSIPHCNVFLRVKLNMASRVYLDFVGALMFVSIFCLTVNMRWICEVKV